MRKWTLLKQSTHAHSWARDFILLPYTVFTRNIGTPKILIELASKVEQFNFTLYYLLMCIIKALRAMVDRLSLNEGWENGHDIELTTISFNSLLPYFKQIVQTLTQRHRTRRLIWVCTVCQCPRCRDPDFTDNSLYTALWRHSDKNNADINNRYLDFV